MQVVDENIEPLVAGLVCLPTQQRFQIETAPLRESKKRF